MTGRVIHITGIVQGVGFRPFVYGLALRYGLKGWVRNTSEGVDIRVDGSTGALESFMTALQAEAPPLAHIDNLTMRECPPDGFATFEIRHSEAILGAAQPISPDIAICADCLRELHDPSDRRYRYPFINCTNCGPRFTIIQDIPYDRPLTTMVDFAMCDACAAEYDDPGDRRFHAQPVACPECGPQVWLEANGERTWGDGAIRQVSALLRQGAILAIKGLGGFHLVCDATNAAAVAELRRRKARPDKPFALMMAHMNQVRAYCEVEAAEEKLLTSPAAPVVLLNRHNPQPSPGIAAEVAPRQRTLGVMLPYTPLHVLLFDANMPPLVMTSGNRSSEPIVTHNQTALEQLASIADAFLMHNRDIHIRTDDSVMRVWRGAELPLRRSRGYVPFPVRLSQAMPSVLAVGGEMKNTFCLTRDQYGLMSHHIGEMGNYATLQSFEQGIAHFERLFRATPVLIVHDMHPDYMASRYAVSRAEADGIPRIAVQHHHAHIVSCMVENGLNGERPVIGVCFDGTGYAPDGTIWGGEFLVADYHQFERAAHFKPMPLPGGDASTRKPARIAAAYLYASGLPPFALLAETEQRILCQQIERGINTPLTSSVGRLFDAVSSLLGVCQVATYEGQAAIELEAIVDPQENGSYPLPETAHGIDPTALLSAVIDDLRNGVAAGVIAARFHSSIAQRIAATCQRIAGETGLRDVVLTGGVFQNTTLLARTVPLLEAANLQVYTHRQVPPNDGGLALGQAVIGYNNWKDQR
jgi:hydrogenase maturation protein HypF